MTDDEIERSVQRYIALSDQAAVPMPNTDFVAVCLRAILGQPCIHCEAISFVVAAEFAAREKGLTELSRTLLETLRQLAALDCDDNNPGE